MRIHFEKCRLCPRNCEVNRFNSATGYCGESSLLKIADIEAHFGEEPPISGKNGSGTVFFSGCSLKCLYCQNYQISSLQLGSPYDVSQVVTQLEKLTNKYHLHNINFVTPDHFIPYTIEIVDELKRIGIKIPIVYNFSGYQKVDSLKMIEQSADIYLPDFKYADEVLAERLSKAPNYPDLSLNALSEMIHQKGFLKSKYDERSEVEVATKGVLVRHLILPGETKNSIDALTLLFCEFGENLPISVMSQYHPIPTCPLPELNRQLSIEEFDLVYEHARSLGFKTMYVQFPRDDKFCEHLDFMPDFTRTNPFPGNTCD